MDPWFVIAVVTLALVVALIALAIAVWVAWQYKLLCDRSLAAAKDAVKIADGAVERSAFLLKIMWMIYDGTTAEDVTALLKADLERHTSEDIDCPLPHPCRICNQPWPCSAARALQALAKPEPITAERHWTYKTPRRTVQ